MQPTASTVIRSVSISAIFGIYTHDGANANLLKSLFMRVDSL
jgi:hypothetical protein